MCLKDAGIAAIKIFPDDEARYNSENILKKEVNGNENNKMIIALNLASQTGQCAHRCIIYSDEKSEPCHRTCEDVPRVVVALRYATGDELGVHIEVVCD